MKAVIVLAAFVLAVGSVSARSTDDAVERGADNAAPITVGPWTFDEYGRHSRMDMGNNRSIELRYEGASNKLIAIRGSDGVWHTQLPQEPSCQLVNPSMPYYCFNGLPPKSMHYDPDSWGPIDPGWAGGGGGGTAPGAGNGGNTGGGGVGGLSCQATCDVANDLWMTGCFFLGAAGQEVAAIICVVSGAATHIACTISCNGRP